MPTFLTDLSRLDLTRVQVPMEEVRKTNQQRFEMEQINGILHFDPQGGVVVAFKDVRGDEFWVRGHVPGRPLMPGVLICECAAQTCSYYYGMAVRRDRFLGFAGMDSVKFRGQVVPGDRLLMIAKPIELRPDKISRFQTQGIVNGKVVFEAVVIGVVM
jgi:3-hydroxyacyl-[acyl-carrier-protein] dehydratase